MSYLFQIFIVIYMLLRSPRDSFTDKYFKQQIVVSETTHLPSKNAICYANYAITQTLLKSWAEMILSDLTDDVTARDCSFFVSAQLCHKTICRLHDRFAKSRRYEVWWVRNQIYLLMRLHKLYDHSSISIFANRKCREIIYNNHI